MTLPFSGAAIRQWLRQLHSAGAVVWHQHRDGKRWLWLGILSELNGCELISRLGKQIANLLSALMPWPAPALRRGRILLDLEQKSREGKASPYLPATIYAGLGDKASYRKG